MSQLEETIYFGYDEGRYVVSRGKPNILERKERLYGSDVAVPASCYDLRLSLSTEEESSVEVPLNPPTKPKLSEVRQKRRRSYVRTDNRFAWRLDVTEVQVSGCESRSDELSRCEPYLIPLINVQCGLLPSAQSRSSSAIYEIEVEMSKAHTKQLAETSEAQADALIEVLAAQLEWAIQHLAPVESDLEVADFLERHNDGGAVALAKRQSGALKAFGNGGLGDQFVPAVGVGSSQSRGSVDLDFIGCMPVSFQRHHFEEVQNGDYYVSEKTDGVRYLMVFTGSKAVLLDRNMQGWRPKPLEGGSGGAQDVLERLAKHIAPGTVFDGEVVINR